MTPFLLSIALTTSAAGAGLGAMPILLALEPAPSAPAPIAAVGPIVQPRQPTQSKQAAPASISSGDDASPWNHR